MEWYRGIGIRKEDRCRIKNFDFKNWESQTWEGKDQSPFRLLLYTCQVQSTFVRRLLEHEPLGREMWLTPVQWKTHNSWTCGMPLWRAGGIYLNAGWRKKTHRSIIFNQLSTSLFLLSFSVSCITSCFWPSFCRKSARRLKKRMAAKKTRLPTSGALHIFCPVKSTIC